MAYFWRSLSWAVLQSMNLCTMLHLCQVHYSSFNIHERMGQGKYYRMANRAQGQLSAGAGDCSALRVLSCVFWGAAGPPTAY
eukprot:2336934-Prymnesium_polylepis.3